MSRTRQGELVGLLKAECRPLRPLRTALEPELTLRGLFRAALFDVYGTMLCSGRSEPGAAAGGGEAAGLNGVLCRAGIRVRSPEAGVEAAAQLAARVSASRRRARARGVDHPEVDIRALWRGVIGRLEASGLIAGAGVTGAVDRVAATWELQVNPVWPMPGVGDALAAARSRGLRMGIVSNAQFYTPLLLESFGRVFDWPAGWDSRLCFWSYRERVAKPSAYLFERAARRLHDDFGIRPGETLYVGNDVRNDIVPARRCGFRTVLFAGDRRSLKRDGGGTPDATVRPDAVITHWRQFAGILCLA